MEPRENELVIILADISGYTKFMMENQLSAIHGQNCITLLIETLLKEVDIPLQLQEIEGDAVFLYAENPGDDAAWQHALADIRTRLLRFFEVFYEALAIGRESTPCECAICAHAEDLHLKIVVHSGSAVFHEIGGKPQVSGPDVILAHRLLKNSVKDDEYLLMSDAAYRDLGAQMEREFISHQEHYESIGDVTIHVHFLNEEADEAVDRFYAMDRDSFARRVKEHYKHMLRGQQAAAWKNLREPIYPANVLSRLAFAIALPIITFRHLPRDRKRIADKLRTRRAARSESKS